MDLSPSIPNAFGPSSGLAILVSLLMPGFFVGLAIAARRARSASRRLALLPMLLIPLFVGLAALWFNHANAAYELHEGAPPDALERLKVAYGTFITSTVSSALCAILFAVAAGDAGRGFPLGGRVATIGAVFLVLGTLGAIATTAAIRSGSPLLSNLEAYAALLGMVSLACALASGLSAGLIHHRPHRDATRPMLLVGTLLLVLIVPIYVLQGSFRG